MKKIEEIKANALKVGQEYTIMSNIGRFSEGEKVKVHSIVPWGDDIKITLINEKGARDFFVLDKNDDINLD